MGPAPGFVLARTVAGGTGDKMKPGTRQRNCCLACGGSVTKTNVSQANPAFHKVCMDDGVDVPLEDGKYSDEQLAGTWAGMESGGAK